MGHTRGVERNWANKDDTCAGDIGAIPASPSRRVGFRPRRRDQAFYAQEDINEEAAGSSLSVSEAAIRNPSTLEEKDSREHSRRLPPARTQEAEMLWFRYLLVAVMVTLGRLLAG